MSENAFSEDDNINQEIDNIQNEIDQLSARLHKEINELKQIDETDVILTSSLDSWDYCFSIALGCFAISVTTSEELAVYLENIHKAASGASGDYDRLQRILGVLFRHKGDDIDKRGGNFKNRKGDNAYGAFHRLLWGHDILSIHSDNPFVLMIKQNGLSGIIQVLQHLIADTASKQGLPLPASSFLDYTKENGSISNYLIKISETLSEESTGNKRATQSIYSRMFTIRATDYSGNISVESLSRGYYSYRGITDNIRKTQIKLLAYIIAFLGHSTIGITRQNAIPYFNVSEFKAIIHNLKNLYKFSRKETKKVIISSERRIKESADIIEEAEQTIRCGRAFKTDDEYVGEIERNQRDSSKLMRFFSEDI